MPFCQSHVVYFRNVVEEYCEDNTTAAIVQKDAELREATSVDFPAEADD
jgi:hypothetical protein